MEDITYHHGSHSMSHILELELNIIQINLFYGKLQNYCNGKSRSYKQIMRVPSNVQKWMNISRKNAISMTWRGEQKGTTPKLYSLRTSIQLSWMRLSGISVKAKEQEAQKEQKLRLFQRLSKSSIYPQIVFTLRSTYDSKTCQMPKSLCPHRSTKTSAWYTHIIHPIISSMA